MFPSPHSGILFLLSIMLAVIVSAGAVSVPSFGDSFFIYSVTTSKYQNMFYVSVPSFGDSFFISVNILKCGKIHYCFRPLIRGFFFYDEWREYTTKITDDSFRPLIRGFFFYYSDTEKNRFNGVVVSVPSFGDSFFIMKISSIIGKLVAGFRPLIRGFFFYLLESMGAVICACISFRPLIRGFFFYR